MCIRDSYVSVRKYEHDDDGTAPGNGFDTGIYITLWLEQAVPSALAFLRMTTPVDTEAT